MKINSRILVVGLCVVLLLSNLGCPLSSSSQMSFEEMELAFFLNAKILCIIWFVDEAMTAPEEIEIELNGSSEPLTFTGFGPTFLGRFLINTDYEWPNDFWFLILSDEDDYTNSAFVDFNGNFIRDSNETRFQRLSESRLQIMTGYGGQTLQAGYYGAYLPPDSLDFAAQGTENFAFDIGVDMRLGNTIVHRNLLLLRNAQVLPHAAFGTLGSDTVVTQVAVNNSHAREAEAEVEFFTPGGQPAEVTIGNRTDHEHTFSVPAKSSVLLEMTSEGPLQVVWGFGYGTEPLDFSLQFGTYSGTGAEAAISPQGMSQVAAGTLVAEAGIAASDVSLNHTLNVNRTADGVDTAFAIANPTGATANIELVLKDDSGERATANLTVDPKSQTAQFFNQLFNTNFETFSGTLLIRSDTAVAVTSLKTLDGLQSSSLPSGIRRIG